MSSEVVRAAMWGRHSPRVIWRALRLDRPLPSALPLLLLSLRTTLPGRRRRCCMYAGVEPCPRPHDLDDAVAMTYSDQVVNEDVGGR